MPQRIAVKAAEMISRCESDEDVHNAVLNVLGTAAGFDHSNRGFVQELRDALRELADAETGPMREQRLRNAVEMVCALC